MILFQIWSCWISLSMLEYSLGVITEYHLFLPSLIPYFYIFWSSFSSMLEFSYPNVCFDYPSSSTLMISPSTFPFKFERVEFSRDSFSPFVHNCWLSFSISDGVVSSFIIKLKLLERRIIWCKKNVFGSLST